MADKGKDERKERARQRLRDLGYDLRNPSAQVYEIIAPDGAVYGRPATIDELESIVADLRQAASKR